jgi:hypothetical protein
MSIWAIVGTYLLLGALFVTCWCVLGWRADQRRRAFELHVATLPTDPEETP